MLPRFLYTFMNKNAFKQIMKDGVLKATEDGCGLHFKSVYLVDFQNLAKSWKSLFYGKTGMNFQTALVGQTLKGEKTICCLKIPTSKLASDSIFVRSQNDLLKIMDENSTQNTVKELYSKGSKYKLYQRNNHAIEYLHQGNIPISKDIEYIGSINVPEKIAPFFENPIESNISGKVTNEGVSEMLKQLFAGRPEVKAL